MSDSMRLLTDLANAVANDYESFDTIVDEVMKWARAEGRSFRREDILEALRALIRDGYVRAYEMTPEPRVADFTPERLNELWFYATPIGKKLANGQL
jgi:hypothetical protein